MSGVDHKKAPECPLVFLTNFRCGFYSWTICITDLHETIPMTHVCYYHTLTLFVQETGTRSMLWVVCTTTRHLNVPLFFSLISGVDFTRGQYALRIYMKQFPDPVFSFLYWRVGSGNIFRCKDFKVYFFLTDYRRGFHPWTVCITDLHETIPWSLVCENKISKLHRYPVFHKSALSNEEGRWVVYI